jgi:hypothetical protein
MANDDPVIAHLDSIGATTRFNSAMGVGDQTTSIHDLIKLDFLIFRNELVATGRWEQYRDQWRTAYLKAMEVQEKEAKQYGTD